MKDIEYSKIKKGLYAICEDGVVISKTTKRPMKTSLDKDGYVCLSLRNTGASYSKFGIHRLLMIAFSPIHDMENLQVNHKDGIKINNSLSNLEWVTVQENLKHARDTGLNKTINNANYEGKDVKRIIDMLMEGYSTREIIEEFPKMTRGTISKIRTGGSWAALTKGLSFPPPVNVKSYNRQQIEDTCRYIVEGKDNTTIMNLVFGKKEKKFNQFIRDIRTKTSHTAISNKYF